MATAAMYAAVQTGKVHSSEGKIFHCTFYTNLPESKETKRNLMFKERIQEQSLKYPTYLP